jgi:hypothetical protein
MTPLQAATASFATLGGQKLSPNLLTSTTTLTNNTGDSLFYVGGAETSAWTKHSGAIALSYNISPSVTAQVFYAGESTIAGAGNASASEYPFLPGPSYSGAPFLPGQQYITESPGPFSNMIERTHASLLEQKITAYLWGGTLRLAALQGTSGTAISPSCCFSGQYTLYGTGCLGGTGAIPANGICSGGSTPVTYNGTPALLAFAIDAGGFENCTATTSNRDFLLSYAHQVGSRSSVGFSYVTSYYNEPSATTGMFFISGTPFFESFVRPSAISATSNEARLFGTSELSDKLTLEGSWYFTRSDYHVPNNNNNGGQTIPFVFSGGGFQEIETLPSSYVDSIFTYSAPRLSLTWRVNHDTVIRAAAGGGYALPKLSFFTNPNTSVTCTGGIQCSLALTNFNIQPEKSFGFDMGTDMRLRHNTVLSFDAYLTNLYGQFFSTTNLNGTCSSQPTCPTGEGALPLYTTQQGNLDQTRMEGINIEIRHDVPKGIYWQGSLGLTRGYVVSVPAGFYDTAAAVKAGTPCLATLTAANCQNQYVIPGANFNGFFDSAVPYANGSATIGYRWAPGKYVDLSPTYFGNNNSYYEPAFLEFDAHAGYPLTKNVSLMATFSNITGIYGGSQSVIFHCPCLTAPVLPGTPQQTYGLYGAPYGPRTVIFTLNIRE